MEYADSLWAHLGGDAATDVSTQAEVDQWLEKLLDEAEDDNLDTEGVDNEPIAETTWNSASRLVTRTAAILQRTATGEPDFIEAARRIIANGAYETVDGMLFDAFSASAVLGVYDALSDENKEKMAAMGLAKAVTISFKLINKGSAMVTPMSRKQAAGQFYVSVYRREDGSVTYKGPYTDEADAKREADAWNGAESSIEGRSWRAKVVSGPEAEADFAAWQKATTREHDWEDPKRYFPYSSRKRAARGPDESYPHVILEVINKDRSLAEIERYLYPNWHAQQIEDGTIFISGHDIPGYGMVPLRDRLLSGLIGTEIRGHTGSDTQPAVHPPGQGTTWARRRVALSQDEYDKWFQAGMNGDPKPTDPDQLSAWEDGKDNQREIKRTYSSRHTAADPGLLFGGSVEVFDESEGYSFTMNVSGDSAEAAINEAVRQNPLFCSSGGWAKFNGTTYNWKRTGEYPEAGAIVSAARRRPTAMRKRATEVPDDYEVKVLKPGTKAYDNAKDLATCGTCGRSWDDAVVTGITPAPSARCPFEYFHDYDDEDDGEDDGYDPRYDSPDAWKWQSGQTGVSSFATRKRAAAPDLREIEQWCDTQGLVMKDFPDSLIDRAAETGDTSILEEWIDNNEPRTKGMWEASRRHAVDEAVEHDDIQTVEGTATGEDDEEEWYEDWVHRYVDHIFGASTTAANTALTAIDDAELIDWQRRKKEEEEGLVDWGGVKPQNYEKELKTHIYSDSQRRIDELD